MATSTGADARVKAGFWFSTTELQVTEIDSNLFTHLYAGFAKVQYPIKPGAKMTDYVIQFPDSSGRFESFPKIVKKINPGVKALLSIGGEEQDISAAIASVVRDAENGLRNAFISRSIELARSYGYDGLDLCWLYPSNDNQQTSHLVSLLNEWRQAVDKEDTTSHTKRPKLLLTATVFHDPVMDRGNSFQYPVQALSQNMDWINVLATDFYTPSNSPSATGPVHAWLNTKNQERCGSGGIREWTRNNEVAAEKLVLGLPFYGYEWSLDNPVNSLFFAPAHASANIKPILYRTIQEMLQTGNYVLPPIYDKDYVATYTHNDKGTWIGYDDIRSISAKVRDAMRTFKLRGYFAWNVGGDDRVWTLSTAAYEALQPVNG